MGYLNGSPSMSSSSYSPSGSHHFRNRQDLLAVALDNKHLKRRSQIEQMQLQHGGGSPSLPLHPIYELTRPRNRQTKTLLVIIVTCSLCSIWFLVGWISGDAASASVDSEERSLQDLADSLRRVRLRRHQAMHGQRSEDGTTIPENGLNDVENVLVGGEISQHYYNLRDPPEPRNEFEIPPESKEKAERFEKLEQRIRFTQDRNIKEEMRAKRLENNMAESILALKEYVIHEAPKITKDVEKESFT